MTTPITRIAGAAVAAIALVAGVWFLLVFHPEGHKLTVAHKARAAAEQKISALNGQISQLHALVAQVPADTKALASLKQAVPDNPDLAGAIRQIDAAAAASGVTVSQLTPSAPASPAAGAKAATGAPAITLSFGASGPYPAVMRFLTLLSGSPRVFTVQSLALSTSGSNVAATIGARMYDTGQPTP